MKEKKDVLVIGGGVIGLCCAYFLTQEGHRVRIIDRMPEGDKTGCSFGNAGYVCPSHFVPLAAPGMITKGLKWMLNPESPFYVKPRFNTDLIRWVLNFKRATSLKRMEGAIPILKDLGIHSRELFEQMESSLGFTLVKKGLIMLCKEQVSLDEEIGLAQRANEFGIGASSLSSQDISSLQNGLSLKAAGGVIYPTDAHLEPGEFMGSLYSDLKAKGVEFHHSAEALDFVKEGSRIKAIKTDGKLLEAEEFVLAAGSWSPLLAKKLGLNLPIQVGKGYSLTVPGMGSMLEVPMILLEGKVAVTPMGDDLRFAGTMEITGYDQRVNPKRISGMLKTIASYLPDLPIDRIKDVAPWSGFRPCSPDGLPYIGRFRDHENLVAATGHAMLGLSLSAVTGKLVSEVISEQMPLVELNSLSPDRYNGR